MAKSVGRPGEPAPGAFRYGPISREPSGFRPVGRLRQRYPLLRSWLCLHRGVSQEKLPAYLAFFQVAHNARRRGKALLATLVGALVT